MSKKKMSQADLDAAMRQALEKGEIKTTAQFAQVHGVSVARADSSLARVTRRTRWRKSRH